MKNRDEVVGDNGGSKKKWEVKMVLIQSIILEGTANVVSWNPIKGVQ